MIESLMQYAFEPGVWALSLLVFCAIATITSSLALRGSRRKFLALVSEITSEDNLTRADKAWLRSEIEQSKGTHLLVAAPFAPFAIVAALVFAAYEGWDDEVGHISSAGLAKERERLARLDERLDAVHARVIKESEGVDPMEGNFWHDPRRQEIGRLVNDLETWNNPIAMSWIIAWLVVASPLMIIAYLVSGSLKPFVTNVWDPLRGPVMAALASLHVKGTHSQV